ncbi:hypothetical protein P8629_02715 [Hydrogenovibrio sp. 3SP14C1]|uniref:hypothetical protein n=1 Tax=Hydrogenovibrio sp. 3SP14C1 TaxID=3038774 RepID=UPI002416DBB2|nr:hypothetical protein [Hydrogenovibrio sp. 3SP14C1]MDG4811909.1 hypothetical protein [Hydrogenovibrio sp. 3SP14C1]
MDISQIRLQNLEALIIEHGSAAFIADKIGSDASVISVIRSEKYPEKNMGKNIARRIEKEFKLPDGWMDKDHTIENKTFLSSGTVQSEPGEYLNSSPLFALTSESKKSLIQEIIKAIENNEISDEQADAFRALLKSISPQKQDGRFKKS